MPRAKGSKQRKAVARAKAATKAAPCVRALHKEWEAVFCAQMLQFLNKSLGAPELSVRNEKFMGPEFLGALRLHRMYIMEMTELFRAGKMMTGAALKPECVREIRKGASGCSVKLRGLVASCNASERPQLVEELVAICKERKQPLLAEQLEAE